MFFKRAKPLFISLLFTWQYSTNLTIMIQSLDVVLGTPTRGGMKVGADKSTEQWKHPWRQYVDCTDKQCDQIVIFLEGIDNRFSPYVPQSLCNYFRYFEKCYFLSKTALFTNWATFEKNWAVLQYCRRNIFCRPKKPKNENLTFCRHSRCC